MRIAVPISLLTLLAGCVNMMSGLDGGSKFACKAPDGVVCTSVSGVYANSVSGSLPSQQHATKGSVDSKAVPDPKPYNASPPTTTAPAPGTPLLSSPKVLRLWIAPWVDEDGDLHDQSYLYVMWHRGEWQIEHTRRQIQRQFTPVVAPAGYSTPAPAERKNDFSQDAQEVMLNLRQGSVSGDDRDR